MRVIIPKIIISLSCILFFIGNVDGQPAWADVNYANNDGNIRHDLDIYLPDSGTGPFPVVVYIHGGGWQDGNKSNVGGISPIIDEGYALVSINYRLTAEAIYPAQINDCKAAIRWMRANATTYNLDASRIGVIGTSAGGHLVALLGTSGDVTTHTVGDATMDIEGNVGGNLSYSSRVQAVSDWFGPTDFLKMNDFPGNIDHDAANSPESKLVGGPIQDNPNECALANPITYASKDDAPFLVIHGTADMSVPYNQSELLYQALQPLFDSAGTEITLHPVDGAGHGLGSTMSTETFNMMVEFFNRNIISSTSVKGFKSTSKGLIQLIKIYTSSYNSKLKIFYKVQFPGYVKLEIYNTKGKLVDIHVNAYKQAGDYRIFWNNYKHSAGTYFCKLTAGKYTETAKILLLE